MHVQTVVLSGNHGNAALLLQLQVQPYVVSNLELLIDALSTLALGPPIELCQQTTPYLLLLLARR